MATERRAIVASSSGASSGGSSATWTPPCPAYSRASSHCARCPSSPPNSGACGRRALRPSRRSNAYAEFLLERYGDGRALGADRGEHHRGCCSPGRASPTDRGASRTRRVESRAAPSGRGKLFMHGVSPGVADSRCVVARAQHRNAVWGGPDLRVVTRLDDDEHQYLGEPAPDLPDQVARSPARVSFRLS